jgi:hypothetical protein
MSNELTTITIVLEVAGSEYIHQTEGTHWRRDESRTVYVYNDDETLLEVDSDHFAAAFYEDEIETVDTIST